MAVYELNIEDKDGIELNIGDGITLYDLLGGKVLYSEGIY